MVLTGPDVSHHQGAINWPAVAGAGHDFAWCKATEGTGHRDTRFPANWAGIRGAGMVRGAYHFLRSDSDPAAQARFFLSIVGDLRGSMAALDVESSGASRPSGAQARAFVGEYRRRTGGRPIVIYTGRWYWRDTIGNPHGADLGPLWHSAYSSTPGPLYGGWNRFSFWQWTDAGSCPGVAGPCDLNNFDGDRDDLLVLAGEADMPLNDADKAWLRRLSYDRRDEIVRAADAAALRAMHMLTTGSENALFSGDRHPWIRDDETITMPEVLASARASAATGGDEGEAEATRSLVARLSPQAIAAALSDDAARELAQALAERLGNGDPNG
jgi:lysozyme